MNLSKEEVEERNSQSNITYDLNDPENYYCLGIYDEDNNIWRCANRKILDINENLIEYAIPFPGIYAVIYMPKRGEINTNDDCEFVCDYRKKFYILFLLIIPLSALLYYYISNEYGDYITEKK